MSPRTVSEWIRSHLLGETMSHSTAVALADSRWLYGFDERCYSRLVVGAHRYEQLGSGCYDSIGSAIERLRAYQVTGNREHLVDAANLTRVEWCHPTHPGAHWSASDDELHQQEIRDDT